MPRKWSEKGNPPCSNLRSDRSVARRERWLAEPVESESRYRGDEVASARKGAEIDGRLEQNSAYSRCQTPTDPDKKEEVRKKNCEVSSKCVIIMSYFLLHNSYFLLINMVAVVQWQSASLWMKMLSVRVRSATPKWPPSQGGHFSFGWAT